MNNAKKNPAAVALGRLGGLAPKSKPFGLAAVSKKKLKEVSRLGVEARRRKRIKELKQRGKPDDEKNS